jgi:arylsulfatase/arylsulfatase A
MRAAYEEWFEDVGRPGYDPPRIHIGSARQQVVLLTRQDWRGPTAGWDDRSLGYYEVEVLQPGPYEVELRFPPAPAAGKAELEFRGIIAVSSLSSGESKAIFSKVRFPPGAGRIEARIRMENMVVGAHYVQIRPAGVPS